MKLSLSASSAGTGPFAPSSLVHRIRFFAFVTTLAVFGANDAFAVDYYWRGSGSDTWNHLSKWTAAPTSGGNPSSCLLTDTFIVGSTAGVLNTGYTPGSAFSGGILRLISGGTINLRLSGVPTRWSITSFPPEARIAAAFYDTRTALVATAFENRAGVLSLDTGSGTSLGRNLTLEIGTLTGSGNFTLTETSNRLRTLFISVTDATAYTGAFDFPAA